jgi:hypothetical protein
MVVLFAFLGNGLLIAGKKRRVLQIPKSIRNPFARCFKPKIHQSSDRQNSNPIILRHEFHLRRRPLASSVASKTSILAAVCSHVTTDVPSAHQCTFGCFLAVACAFGCFLAVARAGDLRRHVKLASIGHFGTLVSCPRSTVSVSDSCCSVSCFWTRYLVTSRIGDRTREP